MSQTIEEIKASFEAPTHKVVNGEQVDLSAEEIEETLNTWAENELARQEVLDQLSKASTNVANQFFKYEEQEDGTYKLVIPKFEQNYGESDMLNAVLTNIKNYRENRAGASSSSTAPTGTGAARSPVFRVGI